MRKAIYKKSKEWSKTDLLRPYSLARQAVSKVSSRISNIIQRQMYSEIYVSTLFDVMNKVRMDLEKLYRWKT